MLSQSVNCLWCYNIWFTHSWIHFHYLLLDEMFLSSATFNLCLTCIYFSRMCVYLCPCSGDTSQDIKIWKSKVLRKNEKKWLLYPAVSFPSLNRNELDSERFFWTGKLKHYTNYVGYNEGLFKKKKPWK